MNDSLLEGSLVSSVGNIHRTFQHYIQTLLRTY